MHRILLAAATLAVLALPSAAQAQSRTVTGAAIGAGTGAVIAGPPGAVVGGVAGAVIGGPDLRRPRHRVCWHSNGQRHCRWR
jgi:osmotically inducible lipoprotein OsmB